MRKIDAAWLGGLFDGRGYIGWVGKNSVTLRLNLIDPSVATRVQRITETGTIGIRDRELKPDVHYWVISNKEDVTRILTAILPHLGDRQRKRAVKAFQRLKHVRDSGKCKNGHPMSGKNLYVSADGHRQCRKCARRRDDMRSRGVPEGVLPEQVDPYMPAGITSP